MLWRIAAGAAHAKHERSPYKNMTKWKPIFAAIMGTILVVVVGSGCSSLRHLDGPSFIKQADQIQQVNSACWTDYIGTTHDRAYLEYGTAITFFGSKPKRIVYWTNLAELPDDIVERLKSGSSPWGKTAKLPGDVDKEIRPAKDK